MKHLALALLLACGGDAFDIPDVQDVAQFVAPPAPRAKNWCCEGTRHGEPVLGCGYEQKPDDSATCYCAGIVHTNGDCTDTKTYLPGTLCTMSDEVCW